MKRRRCLNTVIPAVPDKACVANRPRLASSDVDELSMSNNRPLFLTASLGSIDDLLNRKQYEAVDDWVLYIGLFDGYVVNNFLE